MKYAQLVCADSHNVGDDIQSIAAARQLPHVDTYVDRERLDTVSEPSPIGTIMNSWFMHGSGWPPSDAICPIFVGFHVAPRSRELVARHAQYLKRHEPIGTRDTGTADFLRSLGIAAEVTYCMSLTFESRAKQPVLGRTIIVDANTIDIPLTLRRRALLLSHVIPLLRNGTKLQYARELIEYYRDNAGLIITTRLHCALPCIAIGIPVVFFGDPEDYRTRIVSDVGGIVYDQRAHRANVSPLDTAAKALKPIDWSPKPVDVAPVKERLLRAVSARMQAMTCAK